MRCSQLFGSLRSRKLIDRLSFFSSGMRLTWARTPLERPNTIHKDRVRGGRCGRQRSDRKQLEPRCLSPSAGRRSRVFIPRVSYPGRVSESRHTCGDLSPL